MPFSYEVESFSPTGITKTRSVSISSKSVGSTSDAAAAFSLARNRLKEALQSPSGKLTLSPEIVIPQPTDPTAILLQGSQIEKLSEQLRTNAKANAVWVKGSIASMRQLVAEQETSRGSFPSPLPAIYCPKNDDCSREDLEELAEAGASGFLLTMNNDPVHLPSDMLARLEEDTLSRFQLILECGLQPIPEIILSPECSDWKEEQVEELVQILTEKCGEQNIVSILLSVSSPEEDELFFPPSISKSLKKQLTILGSVRAPPHEDEQNEDGVGIATHTQELSKRNYAGAFLRSECLPGFRINADLEFVTKFWSFQIGDLKSSRSKTFSFRSKNKMGKNLATQWMNYQSDVMESGALGEQSAKAGEFNPEEGDYVGF